MVNSHQPVLFNFQESVFAKNYATKLILPNWTSIKLLKSGCINLIIVIVLLEQNIIIIPYPLIKISPLINTIF